MWFRICFHEDSAYVWTGYVPYVFIECGYNFHTSEAGHCAFFDEELLPLHCSQQALGADELAFF